MDISMFMTIGGYALGFGLALLVAFGPGSY